MLPTGNSACFEYAESPLFAGLTLLALESRAGGLRDYAPLGIFGLALTGTLYSAYLTYVELFVIHAVCPYCVASAVLITGLLIMAVVRLVRGPVLARPQPRLARRAPRNLGPRLPPRRP